MDLSSGWSRNPVCKFSWRYHHHYYIDFMVRTDPRITDTHTHPHTTPRVSVETYRPWGECHQVQKQLLRYTILFPYCKNFACLRIALNTCQNWRLWSWSRACSKREDFAIPSPKDKSQLKSREKNIKRLVSHKGSRRLFVVCEMKLCCSPSYFSMISRVLMPSTHSTSSNVRSVFARILLTLVKTTSQFSCVRGEKRFSFLSYDPRLHVSNNSLLVFLLQRNLTPEN